MNLEQITEEVVKVAREAGEYIRAQRRDFDSDKVEAKGTHDYVSYVDKETEKLIVARLKEILPQAKFVTEEGTAIDISNEVKSGVGSPNAKELTWVIDPLDGTSNFVHNMAPYCVAIGLKEEDRVLVGVVYEIVGDEMFYSYEGGKSYMNGQEIHVGKAECVNDAFVCIGYPYNVCDWKPKMKQLVEELYGNCISIRNLGSAQTEICYVACGRFDAYIESYIKPWDVTAGSIIVKNAGGCITDYSGGNKWLTGEETLATNGIIHNELLTRIKDIL